MEGNALVDDIQLYKKGWWIKVSPLARKEPECWICAIFKKGKFSWITEVCKDFDDPQSAYEWAWKTIKERQIAEEDVSQKVEPPK